MTAISLAIVAKSSEPLYIKQFFDEGSSNEADLISEEELFGLPAPTESNESSSPNKKHPDCSLRQQFILHAALDRFEQLDGPPPGYAWRSPGVSGADAMFVGLLCPVEDMRVYGKASKWRTALRILYRSNLCDFLSLSSPFLISFTKRLHDNDANKVFARSSRGRRSVGGSTDN
jgi:hypothetical protein